MVYVCIYIQTIMAKILTIQVEDVEVDENETLLNTDESILKC